MGDINWVEFSLQRVLLPSAFDFAKTFVNPPSLAIAALNPKLSIAWLTSWIVDAFL